MQVLVSMHNSSDLAKDPGIQTGVSRPAATFKRTSSAKEVQQVSLMLGGEYKIGAELLAHAAEVEPFVPAFQHNVRVLKKLLETNQWPVEEFVLELFYSRGN